jgi:hypothetical protein
MSSHNDNAHKTPQGVSPVSRIPNGPEGAFFPIAWTSTPRNLRTDAQEEILLNLARHVYG